MPSRRRARRQLDTTIPSPCIGVCQLHSQHAYCIGCYRSQDELRDWMIMSRDEKLQVLDNMAVRKTQEAS